MEENNTEDLLLIQRVLRGEQQAFQQLVERYQDLVFTLVLRVLQSREEAEEVTQDVFLKVYNRLGQFEQRSRLSTWIYTIAYREALDQIRKKKRMLATLSPEDSTLPLVDNTTASPMQSLQEQDMQALVSQALGRLRPEDALVLHLFYLQDHSVQEVAGVTGMTTSNIKTKLHRLREQLRVDITPRWRKELFD